MRFFLLMMYTLLFGALGLSACTVTSTGGTAEASKVGFDPSLSAMPDQGAGDYGVDGTLIEADLLALTYLAWPQSYDGLSKRFGFPAKRSDNTDYYKTPGGQWVAIFYNGPMATGYSLSDSGQ